MLNSMFDELKEEITLKKSQILRVLNNVIKRHEEIKRLESLLVKAEAYLESKRASKMELFCEYT